MPSQQTEKWNIFPDVFLFIYQPTPNTHAETTIMCVKMSNSCRTSSEKVFTVLCEFLYRWEIVSKFFDRSSQHPEPNWCYHTNGDALKAVNICYLLVFDSLSRRHPRTLSRISYVSNVGYGRCVSIHLKVQLIFQRWCFKHRSYH